MARLRELGYDARQAHDAPSALELAAQDEIDLLFTDIVMPGGVTGFDLAKSLRDARPNLKVLFTSGYAEPELVTRHQGGETHWLGKPYSAAELAKALRKALAGSAEA
jgi:CheY-like chemotaxis protein